MPRHLLLVDGDEPKRRTLEFTLERAGFRVSTVESPDDGLALAHRDLPDLALLDGSLPGMDTFGVLHNFRYHLDVPVIVVTAPWRRGTPAFSRRADPP